MDSLQSLGPEQQALIALIGVLILVSALAVYYLYKVVTAYPEQKTAPQEVCGQLRCKSYPFVALRTHQNGD